jgi:hypothetical protein
VVRYPRKSACIRLRKAYGATGSAVVFPVCVGRGKDLKTCSDRKYPMLEKTYER